MHYNIRIATKEDAPLISHLAEVIWNEHYPAMITQGQIDYMLEKGYSVPALQKQMEQGHAIHLISDGDKTFGYLSIENTDKKKGEYFLHKFYVTAEYRRTGGGKYLFDYVLNKIEKEGLSLIRLFVNRENFKAINFYFKMGFVIEKIIDQPIGEGYFMNDFIMIKRI